MSDSSLRTLERRWKESGSIRDESRYLLERTRAGELPQINLRLAALCACPPAVAAMGPGPEEHIFVGDWMRAFKHTAAAWYPELQLRAVHGACWAAVLTLLAQYRTPWMPGEIGRAFQLTAYRILGGVEPDPADVITTLQQEYIETAEATNSIFGAYGKDVGTALQVLRQAGAAHAQGQVKSTEESANYSLRWSESVIGIDGIYHSLAFMLAPYLIYGEDPLVWWREDVRFLYRGLNLHVKNNPWWKDAAAS